MFWQIPGSACGSEAFGKVMRCDDRGWLGKLGELMI